MGTTSAICKSKHMHLHTGITKILIISANHNMTLIYTHLVNMCYSKLTQVTACNCEGASIAYRQKSVSNLNIYFQVCKSIHPQTLICLLVLVHIRVDSVIPADQKTEPYANHNTDMQKPNLLTQIPAHVDGNMRCWYMDSPLSIQTSYRCLHVYTCVYATLWVETRTLEDKLLKPFGETAGQVVWFKGQAFSKNMAELSGINLSSLGQVTWQNRAKVHSPTSIVKLGIFYKKIKIGGRQFEKRVLLNSKTWKKR